MLKRSEPRQMKMAFVTLDELMPETHFLRELDSLVSFDFIYDKVSDLYSSTGRPSVDPVVLIKMLLIGYLYGIDSERRLEQEITVNIAYRWFLGIDLDERVQNGSFSTQQALQKRQHLQIILIGYELTERFVRSVDEVTKRDGISITKGCPQT